MTRHSIGLSDSEILDRLMTRREIVRIGAAGVLGAAPMLIDGSLQRRDARAQSTDGTPTAGESTIYGPATPVGSPQPESTGPAETTIGPAPGDASPVPGVPIESFMDLSLALVGGGKLDPQRGSQLLALIAADPERRRALDDLLAIRVGGEAATPIATPVATLSRDARVLVEQILRFWYLGTWDDQPVTDRAGFWFGLSAWQAVEYTYAPSVCRAFGIWADPPPGRS
jgi:Membrane bound FAD containing D-sorbitol dehydrogenase